MPMPVVVMVTNAAVAAVAAVAGYGAVRSADATHVPNELTALLASQFLSPTHLTIK